MKKSIFLLLLICGFSFASKADTTDYWQVLYNGIKLYDFNGLTENVVKLKFEDIKPEDSITINYFNDHPCSNCFGTIAIMDQSDQIILRKYGIGNSSPFTFKLNDLVANANVIFKVFYLEIPLNVPPRRQGIYFAKLKDEKPIFRIFIE